MKEIRWPFGLGLAVIAVFYLIFFSQQSWKIHTHSLGLVYKTYQRDSANVMQRGTYAFKPIDSQHLKTWDASHYAYLAENFYEPEPNRNFLYAFFPAFPLWWKALHVPIAFVGLINALLVVIAGVFLWNLFPPEWDKQFRIFLWLSVLTFFSFTVIHMPYAEATSFFLLAISLWGLFRKNWFVFGLFGFLFATSRPNILMFLLAWCCAEAWLMLLSRKFQLSSFLRPLPFLLGMIATFGLYAHISGDWGVFFKAQEGWNTKLQVPSRFSDWSNESFPVNIILLGIWVPFLAYQLAFQSVRAFRNKQFYLFSPDKTLDLVLTAGHAFSLGSALFILLFQGGNVHSAHRYLTVNAIFPLLAGYYLYKWITWKNGKKMLFSLMAIGIGFFAMYILDKNKIKPDTFTGFYLISLILPLFLLKKYVPQNKPITFILILYVLICISWQTLLYNQYLSDGWIWV